MEEFTVSRLSALIKRSLEQNFSAIALKAEVSALKLHSSGHIYFSLKDSDAVIDAICWKSVAQKQKIRLEDGMEIRCQGQVTTYPMRSKYQFVVEQFELSGIGELLKILEERKKKLAQDGLFDKDRKKQIPFLPKLIGIITSPTGAVIQDMLHRISQRFPRNILLWPVLVQGLDAGRQVTEAINGMNKLPAEQRPDLLIVARGGGSFEDLMPFNEESVVRAVAASAIPIISAIGHETDTTLIDYAADLRAPTPTAAAEFAVPEKIKLQADVSKLFSKLNFIMASAIDRKKVFLQSNRVLNIRSVISERIQKTDYTFEKTATALQRYIAEKRLQVMRLAVPKLTIKHDMVNFEEKLRFAWETKIIGVKNKLLLLSKSLESNSHMNILKKGFAYVSSPKHRPIISVREAQEYSVLGLTFADGSMMVRREPQQEDLF
ncbi:MAG: exodeoxyribonuclease VII large subunit [Holosporaceae bacterium]|nr:exodeoxyribonuclease VII large subunit [Holosporaceae bacterium]